MWSAAQSEFADALLDAERSVPPMLTSHTTRTPTRRFAVYRNNVVFSLIGALRTRFPVVERIVGVECFAAMARHFIAAHPPQSPVLMFYGDDFPDFIAACLPELPYLPDVARLEAARTHAYHAADAEPIEPASLRALDPDDLASALVALQPSLRIVRSRHPIVTIWAMNSGETELRPLADEEPEDALVVRPRDAVSVIKLPPGGAAFLEALEAGTTLATAAMLAMQQDANFDLAANLAGLIASGAMVAVLAGHSQGRFPL